MRTKVMNAYYSTLKKIKQLKKAGLEVVVKKSRSRDNVEIIEKYDKPDRILPKFWRHVTFKIKDGSDSDRVYRAATQLRENGIWFDTGGCAGERDWELDWSFSYNEFAENEERKVVTYSVEEILKNLDVNVEILV